MAPSSSARVESNAWAVEAQNYVRAKVYGGSPLLRETDLAVPKTYHTQGWPPASPVPSQWLR